MDYQFYKTLPGLDRLLIERLAGPFPATGGQKERYQWVRNADKAMRDMERDRRVVREVWSVSGERLCAFVGAVQRLSSEQTKPQKSEITKRYSKN